MPDSKYGYGVYRITPAGKQMVTSAKSIRGARRALKRLQRRRQGKYTIEPATLRDLYKARKIYG